MKKAYLPLYTIMLSVLMLSSCIKKTDTTMFDKEQISAEILQVMETSKNAWNAGDMEAFMQTYWQADDLLFAGNSGFTMGYDNIAKLYERSFNMEDMGILTYKNMKAFPLAKDIAILKGEFWLEMKETSRNGIYTLVFKKISGEWKMIMDHSSSGCKN